MISHHSDIRPPLFFQTQKDTHADAVYSCLPHAVEPVHPPLEFRFHSARVVDFVIRLVVGFLKTDNAVHAVVRKLAVVFCRKRHHFNLQVREIRLRQIQSTGDVRHTGFGRILARYQQQVLERSQLLYSLVFVHYLLFRKDGALHRVADVETAINARVRTRISNVKRNKHRHCIAKAFPRVLIAKLRHRLQIRFRRRRDKCHKIVHIQMLLRQGTAHIGIGFRSNPGGGLVPIYFL